MSLSNDYNKVTVLIVGGGPAGLSAAIKLKLLKSDIDICVIEKAEKLGNHNLSGASLEPQPLFSLLDEAAPGWQKTEQAKQVFANKVEKSNLLFLLGKKLAFNISPAIKLAKLLKLGIGQMVHTGDYSVSISMLTAYLGQIAKDLGAEILTGFAAEDIILDDNGMTVGIKLVDQGIDKNGNKQPNYVPGEIINPDFVILAEGCDGLVTEKFIEKAHLQRQSPQLFSVGVKQLIKVSPEQYEKFTAGRIVKAMGYPIWTPVIGPSIFGGGIVYPHEPDYLAVGMIAGADWKYYNFNPQDALTLFKEHRFVKKFIDGGTVVEAGAKMIPEGGLFAVPADPQNGNIGKNNCLIIGDSAGFVNMLKIKGLHNAIDSGMLAAQAIADNLSSPQNAADVYTQLVNSSNIAVEMASAKKFRQTVAKLGPLFGLPVSILGRLLPRFKIEPDYKAMKKAAYRLKPNQDFDKQTFTAMAATAHREDQPSHLSIIDGNICAEKCTPVFNSPCITFCPAGVYESIEGEVKPANPSNCLHCKTCQRKCPFDNIRWTVPEGTGGPKYKKM